MRTPFEHESLAILKEGKSSCQMRSRVTPKVRTESQRTPHIYGGTAARFWPDRRSLTERQAKQLKLDDAVNNQV